MRYVGLDAHWRQSTICVLDHRGRKLLSRTIKGPWSKVLEEVGKIRKPFAVCFEASTGYGYLFEHLQTIARRVVVAHPGQLRLIFRSKRKNDRVDAEKLAKLLFLDEVPPVYVPSSEVRSWRGFIGHRYKLVRERTRTKNSIRALLRGLGIRRSPAIRAFYERVRREDPERGKIALVATAHFLLRAMMAMLRTGEVWRLQEEAAA